MTDEELTTAKDALVQRLPATFASVASVNGAITSLWVQGLPDDYYQQYLEVRRRDHERGCPSRGEEPTSMSTIWRSSSLATARRLKGR